MLGTSYDVHDQYTRQDGHVHWVFLEHLMMSMGNIPGRTEMCIGYVHGQDTRQDGDVHWVCLEHLMMSMAKIPGRTEMCIGYAWSIL